MKDREIEEMKHLRRSGLTFDQISNKTQYSINTVKKYCKGIKRGDNQSLITISSNPLAAMQDLNELMQGAMTTGISLGSGIEAIYRGFADENLSDKDRMLLTMKGSSYLGGIAFGTIRTLQELASKSPPDKTAPSPLYDDLKEKAGDLEKENKRLETLVKRYRDRDGKE